MALRMGMLYDALRRAQGVAEEDARQAAEEVAHYAARIDRVERSLSALTWMTGTMIPLQLLAERTVRRAHARGEEVIDVHAEYRKSRAKPAERGWRRRI